MDTSISLTKTLLIFYLLIGSSLLQPLLSKQWNHLVAENRPIQHIIALTTIITLITLLNDTLPLTTILPYSLFIYFWFLLSTKLDIHWNLIFAILLLLTYMHENKLKNEKHRITTDKILSDQEKKVATHTLETHKKYALAALILLVGAGTSMYCQKKQVQYGGGSFDPVKFLFY